LRNQRSEQFWLFIHCNIFNQHIVKCSKSLFQFWVHYILTILASNSVSGGCLGWLWELISKVVGSITRPYPSHFSTSDCKKSSTRRSQLRVIVICSEHRHFAWTFTSLSLYLKDYYYCQFAYSHFSYCHFAYYDLPTTMIWLLGKVRLG